MVARIYKPAKTAMQSGFGNTKGWVLDFEPEAPRRVELGVERVYSAGEGDVEVRVLISPAMCTDSMSGESFPATVSVDLRGQRLQGCGRDLDHPWE